MPEEIKFFADALSFRKWLHKNHQSQSEQWVGLYKRGTKIPSITWPESVDQALCYGWIDGLRKSIDDLSYKIRFTPRKPGSHWSAVNLDRVEYLTKEKLMQPAGLRAFENRDHRRIKQVSYEQQKAIKLTAPFQKKLKKKQRPGWISPKGHPPTASSVSGGS